MKVSLFKSDQIKADSFNKLLRTQNKAIGNISKNLFALFFLNRLVRMSGTFVSIVILGPADFQRAKFCKHEKLGCASFLDKLSAREVDV
jgi:hypothetical protein